MSEPTSQEINNAPPANAKLLPFPPDLLAADHMKQIIRIRTCLIAWIMAEEEAGEGESVLKDAENALSKATQDLAGKQQKVAVT